MKERALSRRERRTVGIGLIFMVGLVCGTRGFPAWRDWQRQTRASAAEIMAEANRAEVDARDLESTLDTLEARKQRFLATAQMLIAVGSPSIGAATLSSRVSTLAAVSGVHIGSIQTFADTGMVPVKRVSAKVDVVGDIRGITTLLAALESGESLLAVRDLSIMQPDAAAPDDRAEALQVQFRVDGLILDRRGDKN